MPTRENPHDIVMTKISLYWLWRSSQRSKIHQLSGECLFFALLIENSQLWSILKITYSSWSGPLTFREGIVGFQRTIFHLRRWKHDSIMNFPTLREENDGSGTTQTGRKSGGVIVSINRDQRLTQISLIWASSASFPPSSENIDSSKEVLLLLFAITLPVLVLWSFMNY